VSVIGANGEKEYENLKFSAYSETAKFTGGGEPIRLVRQIRVGEILKYRNLTSHIVASNTSVSIVVGARRAYASLQS
jgi:hypothetical protein